MDEVLCIIPVRGGSKSLPYKNIRPLGGRPLLYYPIACARAARRITRTIVSTDDAEFAALARLLGAEVPFLRPAELARDETTDLPVFEHALRWLEAHEGYRPDAVVQLRATAPIRDPAKVDEAIEYFLTHPEADSMRSVRESVFPPYKMWSVQGEYLSPLLDAPGITDPYDQPRQALPKSYQQDGFIDVMRPRTVLELHSMAGRRILGFLSHGGSIDIDHPEDLRAAGYQLGAQTSVRSNIGIIQGRLMPSTTGQLQSFPGREWRKEFFLAAALGFSYVELLWEKAPTADNPIYSAGGRAEIKQAAAEAGLELRSLCDDTFVSRPFWANIDGAVSHLRRLMEACADLGVSTCVLPVLEASCPRRCPSPEIGAAYLREAMHLGAKSGVQAAFEFVLPSAEIATLERSVGAPLPICFDTGNLVPLGVSIAAELEALRPRIVHVHIKDKKRAGENVALGTGDSQLNEVLPLLAGYSGPCTFETSRGDDALATAARNLAYFSEHARRAAR